MSKLFSKQVFMHKRTYHPDGDCIVDVMTVTTIFGHMFKKSKAVVMPYGHICNNCVWTGASGQYSPKQDKPCIACPIH